MRRAARAGGAVLAVLCLLAAARALMPLGDRALVPLGVLAAVTAAGLWRTAALRRGALADAVLRPGSRLRWMLAGRLGSGLVALGATTLAVPLLAYQLATLRPAEPLLIAGTTVLAALIFLWFENRLRQEARPRLAPALAARPSAVCAALVMVPVYAWAGWAVWPLPDWIAGGILATLDGALQTLPMRDGLLHGLCAFLLSAEASGLWLLGQLDFAAGPSVLILLRQALVGLALAEVTVAALVLAMGLGREDGNEG
ncbi:hypothetical protein [Anianabacter salinae]|uniref:hypothetical protein n=1 Tax=Anianabacter salinae TaxID=2851023 RepID=UPI00225E280B|nr:hypothetical protein [Anianabacter salinae]MBV0912094.1 hypothetical protein [Anianabacter salinae]